MGRITAYPLSGLSDLELRRYAVRVRSSQATQSHNGAGSWAKIMFDTTIHADQPTAWRGAPNYDYLVPADGLYAVSGYAIFQMASGSGGRWTTALGIFLNDATFSYGNQDHVTGGYAVGDEVGHVAEDEIAVRTGDRIDLRMYSQYGGYVIGANVAFPHLAIRRVGRYPG